MKPNKQKYIDFIIDNLENGNVQYKDVMLLFVSNFQLTEKTFVVYWKLANERHKERQESINKELLSVDIENKKQVLKSTNLDKIGRILIAEEIALKNGDKISASDQLKALDYLAKIYGDFAPVKTEIEINKIEPVTFICK
jgi:hypothetical protein